MGLASATDAFLSQYPLIATLVFLTVVVAAVRQISRRRKGSLPPGPRGLPVLGSVFELAKDPWLTFTEWKKTYGRYRDSVGGLWDTGMLSQVSQGR